MKASHHLKDLIREFSLSIGFHLVGFTDPVVDELTRKRYLKWIQNKKHANLWYLEEKLRIHARFNPEYLLKGVKSIIVLGVSYNDRSFKRETVERQAFISSYALRRDYHRVIRKKLKEVVKFIEGEVKGVKSRIFVDTAPVLERYFAYKAGLGFIGKNNFLINPELGGLLFLGEIFTDLEIEADAPLKKNCGICTLCIDACPTHALLPFEIDLNRCISYHTIENRDEIVDFRLARLFGNRIFGCDECAIACPYNNKNGFSVIPYFGEKVRWDLAGLDLSKLLEMNMEDFEEKFRGTPIRRTGYEALMRNVLIAVSNSEDSNLIDRAKKICKDSKSTLIQRQCKELGFLD